MTLLKLTSYERMRRYLASEMGSNLTDDSTKYNKRDIEIWISSISQNVANFLNRELYIETRTEYKDIGYSQLEFWIQAPPIITITSVYADSTGLWDGGESELSDYYSGVEDASVILNYPESYSAKKALRIIYTGGMAYSGVQSIFTVDTTTNWTVDKFCIGNTSGAVGIVKAIGTLALTIEVLYGIFEINETIDEYDDEAGVTAGDATTATISAKTQTALCESNPDIVTACEAEIRYMWKHKFDYENAGTDKEGTTLRRQNFAKRRLPLQPESIDLLSSYRIPAIL